MQHQEDQDNSIHLCEFGPDRPKAIPALDFSATRERPSDLTRRIEILEATR